MRRDSRGTFRGARGKSSCASAAGLATIFACGIAVAQATDPAEAAIRRGVDLRRQGQDDQALQEFKKAYDVSPNPRALGQIGLAEQALGRWVDAETHVQVALESKTDPWIKKNGPTLRGALESIAKHLGSVQVLGEPAGAEVLIQGSVAGRLPMVSPTRVPIGDAQIEVRHPGFRTMSRMVTVSAGELSRETIVLVRPVVENQTLPSTAQPQIILDRPPAPAQTPMTDASAVPWRRPAVWVAAGLGVAGVGLGIVETFVAIQKSKDFNRLSDNCMDGGNGLILGGARCVQADHDQRVATWTAAIGYGLGGLFGATAIALHLTEPARTPSPRQTAWLTCSPGVASAGAACAAQW